MSNKQLKITLPSLNRRFFRNLLFLAAIVAIGYSSWGSYTMDKRIAAIKGTQDTMKTFLVNTVSSSLNSQKIINDELNENIPGLYDNAQLRYDSLRALAVQNQQTTQNDQ